MTIDNLSNYYEFIQKFDFTETQKAANLAQTNDPAIQNAIYNYFNDVALGYLDPSVRQIFSSATTPAEMATLMTATSGYNVIDNFVNNILINDANFMSVGVTGDPTLISPIILSQFTSDLYLNNSSESSILSAAGLNANSLLQSNFLAFLELQTSNPPGSLDQLLQNWAQFSIVRATLTNVSSSLPSYQGFFNQYFPSGQTPSGVSFTSYVTSFIQQSITQDGYFNPSQFFDSFQNKVFQDAVASEPPATVTSSILYAYEDYATANGTANDPLASVNSQLDSLIASWSSGAINATNTLIPSAFFDSLFVGGTGSYSNATDDTAMNNEFLASINSALNLSVLGESNIVTGGNSASYLFHVFGAFLAKEKSSANPPTTLANLLQDWNTFLNPTAVVTNAALTGSFSGLPTYQAAYDSAYPDAGFIPYVTQFINSQYQINGYFLPSTSYTTFQNAVAASSGQGINTAITNYWNSYNAYYGSTLPISNLGEYISAINSYPFGNNQGSGFINAFQGPGAFFDSLINIGNPGAQANFEANVTSGNGLFEEQAVNSAFQPSFNTLLNLDIPAENSLFNTLAGQSLTQMVNNIFGNFIEGLVGHAPSTTTALLQDWINYITPTAVLTTVAGDVSGLPSYQAAYDAAFKTDVGFTSYLSSFASTHSPNGYFLPSDSYTAFQNAVTTLAQGGGFLEGLLAQTAFQGYVTSGTVGTNPGQTADQTLDTIINNIGNLSGNKWSALLASLNLTLSTQTPAGQAMADVFDNFFKAAPNSTNFSATTPLPDITNIFLNNFENTLSLGTSAEANYLATIATGLPNGTVNDYFDSLIVAFIKQLANGTLPTPTDLNSFISAWNTFLGTPTVGTPTPVLTIAAGTVSYQAYYDAQFGSDAGFTTFLNNFINTEIAANGYFIPSKFYTDFQSAAGAASGTSLGPTIQKAFVDYSFRTFGTPQSPNTALDNYISQQFSNSSVFATLSTNKGPSSFFISLFNQGLLGPNSGSSSITEPSIDSTLLANFSYLLNLNTPAESSLLLGPGSATQDMNKVFAAFLSGETISPPTSLAALLQDWKTFITPTAVLTSAAATGAFSVVPSYQAYYDNLFGTDAGFTAYVTQFINNNSPNGYFLPGQSYVAFQNAVQASSGLTPILNAFIAFEASNNVSYNVTSAIPALNTLISGLNQSFSYNTNNGPAGFFASLFGGNATDDPNINNTYSTNFSSLLNLNILNESSFLTSATTGPTTTTQAMNQAFAAFVAGIKSSPPPPATLGEFQRAWFQFITPTAVLSTAAGTASGLPSYQQYYADNPLGTEDFATYLKNFINTEIATENPATSYFLPSQFYNAFIASTGSFPAIVTAFNSYNTTVNTIPPVTDPISTLNNLFASINYANLNTSNSPAAFFDSLFVGAGTTPYSSTANDSAIASDFLANITNALNLNVS